MKSKTSNDGWIIVVIVYLAIAYFAHWWPFKLKDSTKTPEYHQGYNDGYESGMYNGKQKGNEEGIKKIQDDEQSSHKTYNDGVEDGIEEECAHIRLSVPDVSC